MFHIKYIYQQLFVSNFVHNPINSNKYSVNIVGTQKFYRSPGPWHILQIKNNPLHFILISGREFGNLSLRRLFN